MKDLERELGLKVTRLFIAVKADSDRMVPATRGDSPAVMGALVTEALSTGPAVVLGKLDAELLPAAVAVQDLVVRHPVRRPGRVLYQTCSRVGMMRVGTHTTQCPEFHLARGILRYFTGSQTQLHRERPRSFEKKYTCPAFISCHPDQKHRGWAQALIFMYLPSSPGDPQVLLH